MCRYHTINRLDLLFICKNFLSAAFLTYRLICFCVQHRRRKSVIKEVQNRSNDVVATVAEKKKGEEVAQASMDELWSEFQQWKAYREQRRWSSTRDRLRGVPSRPPPTLPPSSRRVTVSLVGPEWPRQPVSHPSAERNAGENVRLRQDHRRKNADYRRGFISLIQPTDSGHAPAVFTDINGSTSSCRNQLQQSDLSNHLDGAPETGGVAIPPKYRFIPNIPGDNKRRNIVLFDSKEEDQMSTESYV